ncbi:unnamed protein product [Prorocentrum cordatum]|uniref:Uncharacterized protein n=1 Tax=Prorocentrum cordatum TaxID=2364126 RepID=A0ABN9WL25_9DINO|nr:unnamed protein product [Polarella glacialis]
MDGCAVAVRAGAGGRGDCLVAVRSICVGETALEEARVVCVASDAISAAPLEERLRELHARLSGPGGPGAALLGARPGGRPLCRGPGGGPRARLYREWAEEGLAALRAPERASAVEAMLALSFNAYSTAGGRFQAAGSCASLALVRRERDRRGARRGSGPAGVPRAHCSRRRGAGELPHRRGPLQARPAPPGEDRQLGVRLRVSPVRGARGRRAPLRVPPGGLRRHVPVAADARPPPGGGGRPRERAQAAGRLALQRLLAGAAPRRAGRVGRCRGGGAGPPRGAASRPLRRLGGLRGVRREAPIPLARVAVEASPPVAPAEGGRGRWGGGRGSPGGRPENGVRALSWAVFLLRYSFAAEAD